MEVIKVLQDPLRTLSLIQFKHPKIILMMIGLSVLTLVTFQKHLQLLAE